MKCSQTQILENTLLSQTMKHIDLAVLIVDENFKTIYSNDAFEKLSNLSNILDTEFCQKNSCCLNREKKITKIKTDSFSKFICENCIIKKQITETIRKMLPSTEHTIEKIKNTGKLIQRKFYSYSIKPIVVSNKVYAIINIKDVSDLEESKTTITKQKVEIENYSKNYKSEMNMAKRVQMSIIPKISLETRDIKIMYKYLPLAAVGGDSLDYFKINEDNIAIFICDIVGHNLASSMITTLIKASIDSMTHLHMKPKEMMCFLNRQVIKIVSGYFLSGIYGVLNLKSKVFTYVRAGHPHPILLNNLGARMIGNKRNIVLGVEDKPVFEEDKIKIKKNEKIILYTDGLYEVGTKSSGYESELMAYLEKNSKDSLKNILDSLEISFKKRLKLNKNKDDLSILGIEF